MENHQIQKHVNFTNDDQKYLEKFEICVEIELSLVQR